ncbi:MAG: NADPH-dependent 7-cyano-7-deazaguanine reductase QueF [Pseudoxanthomonas sp.]
MSHTPHDSTLGRDVVYPSQYDPGLLFPIPRGTARAQIGIADDALPFAGHDRWQAYELGWLDARGKPQVATATFTVPCASPNLIESKSLKLYLNSLNDERFNSAEAVRERIAGDLSARAGAVVEVAFGLPPLHEGDNGDCIDALDIDIDDYGPPNAAFLIADQGDVVEERLLSHLFKSNCPVTGQPDWASVVLCYHGPRIDRAGLLRYLCSFRHHDEFHEQCVERIFAEVSAYCAPLALSVEARFTRRGGLDINPWRATPGLAATAPIREPRQ